MNKVKWGSSNVFIVNFEQSKHNIQHIDLMLLFTTLNMHSTGWLENRSRDWTADFEQVLPSVNDKNIFESINVN